MTSWAREAEWWQIGVLTVVLNVVTIASSIVLWRALVRRRGVDAQTRATTRRDRALAAATVGVNSLALLPAWWAWRRGWIDLPDRGVGRTVVDVGYLVLGLDLVMYVLHRMFHADPLYGWFHSMHHTDDERMSPLTLFVMHPLEAGGFGVATGLLMAIRPVSMPAVVAFFVVNLIVGTEAHVPRSRDAGVRSRIGRAIQRWVGGSPLHAGHHRDPRSNFGFFTQIWDRALGTIGSRR